MNWPLCACGCGEPVRASKKGTPTLYATSNCTSRASWQRIHHESAPDRTHMQDRCTGPALPIAPVVAFIEARIAREKRLLGGQEAITIVCEQLGINSRTLYRWKKGEASTARAGMVDVIATRANGFWWDIYCPDKFPEEYKQAERVFG